MKRDELLNQEEDIEWVWSDLNIFSPLVSYRGKDGIILHNKILTFTGNPGSGKTRFVLQLLNHLKGMNPEWNAVFYSYEMNASDVSYLAEMLHINEDIDYCFTDSKPEYKENTIYLIDSVDALSESVYGDKFPSIKLSQDMKELKKNNVILLIQHLIKGKKEISGVASHKRNIDYLFRLTKHSSGVTISSAEKNRYLGSKQELELQHADDGLKLKENVFGGFFNKLKSFGTDLLKPKVSVSGSGVNVSVGVPGARVGVNTKGELSFRANKGPVSFSKRKKVLKKKK